jgi:HAD superfamily hydrolase (TIGR01509 family)
MPGDVRAVLFDVAGTLAMPEDRDTWLAAAATAAGVVLDGNAADLAARLEAAGRPGGPYPASVPAAVRDAYAARDRDPEAHRAAYTALLATVAPAPLATALYERIRDPGGWSLYADTLPVLRALRERGVRIAAVSNVGCDLRPVLRAHGVLELLDAVVFSFEVGAIKPEPAIFLAACDAVGVTPAEALMVGDHPAADGGAADAGIRTLLLPMSPAGATHGLAAVLALV